MAIGKALKSLQK